MLSHRSHVLRMRIVWEDADGLARMLDGALSPPAPG